MGEGVQGRKTRKGLERKTSSSSSGSGWKWDESRWDAGGHVVVGSLGGVDGADVGCTDTRMRLRILQVVVVVAQMVAVAYLKGNYRGQECRWEKSDEFKR